MATLSPTTSLPSSSKSRSAESGPSPWLLLAGIVAAIAGYMAALLDACCWQMTLYHLSQAGRALSADQAVALRNLVEYDHAHDCQVAWCPDTIEDDGCTLNPHECQLLRACATARVPHTLIDAFAPRYSYTSLYPRPT